MARCAPSWARNYHSPRRPARIKRSLNPEPAARLCSSADKRRSQDTQLWHISCGTKRTLRDVCHLSASLIGPSGSSTFRPSTTPVSMSLTGSRFSSDSAPRPFAVRLVDLCLQHPYPSDDLQDQG